ncbi:MAG: alpha-2-macroglobulin domain protein, partial [Massilia sp.]|nr:alpha-2-macroglobulin domain protein [Massilia sp.]
LAAAYQLQKQDRMASDLMDRQVARLVKPVQPVALEAYYFVDPLLEDAQALYLLARHFPARAKALPPEVMTKLVKTLGENRYNTLSGAYLILAFDAYANAVGPEAMGKLSIIEVDAKGGKRALALPNNLIPRVPFTPGTAKLLFGNDSGVVSYYTVTETGFDREVPKAERRDGMEVLREFVDSAGKPVTTVTVGDEVTVRLKFRAVGRAFVSNVALVDLMPGGFEPVLDTAAPPPADGHAESRALPGLAQSSSTWKIHYADVREDRVVFYGNVSSDFSELSYRIKATNSGRFVVPPAYAESMYERGVQARSAGANTITVTAPGKK